MKRVAFCFFVHSNNTNFVGIIFLCLGNARSAFIMFCLSIFIHMSGYNAISVYAEIIVISCGVSSSVRPSTVVMGLGLSSIVAGLASMFMIDKFGRKSLLIVSSIGTACALGSLGMHFHLISIGLNSATLTWLPITSLLLFSVFLAWGWLPVSSVLMGELFPANLKNIASFLIAITNASLGFLCVKTYQPILNIVGERFLFWIYALAALLCGPFVFFFVPETKGRSLLQIQKSANS